MITLEFEEADLVILNKALCNLPYKDVVMLIDKINSQLKKENN